MTFKNTCQNSMLWFPTQLDSATSAASAVHAKQENIKVSIDFRNGMELAKLNKIFSLFVAAVVAESSWKLESFMKRLHLLINFSSESPHFASFFNTSGNTFHHLCYYKYPFLPSKCPKNGFEICQFFCSSQFSQHKYYIQLLAESILVSGWI